MDGIMEKVPTVLGMEGMNSLDYGIVILISFSILMGIWRGFVREAMSLVTWVTAILVAIIYCETVANWFTMISMIGLRLLLAFILLVLFTLILGGLFGYMIGRLIKFTGFGVTDRIMGSVFGLARGAAVIAVVVLLAAPTPIAKDPLWVKSLLVPRFEPVSAWMKQQLPEDLLKKIQL